VGALNFFFFSNGSRGVGGPKGDMGPPPLWILAFNASMTLLCDNLSSSFEMDSLLRFNDFFVSVTDGEMGDVWRWYGCRRG
jgi:hypothetical protein